eukprot:TRINITY_DN7075_c0_g1_i1.p1 TRINITY_DN7075_c0_g1~~TRINITY_DN7075_c0_g1_i1.p1  ORF type:complete len:223 (-),score=42.17 TRINITY_DN7075_c0_g1_i1:323-925(-)
MAIATSANIGSAALPVGNPQNMIIATASGVSFIEFFKVSVIATAVGVVLNTGLLCLMYKKHLSGGMNLNSKSTSQGEKEALNPVTKSIYTTGEGEEETTEIIVDQDSPGAVLLTLSGNIRPSKPADDYDHNVHDDRELLRHEKGFKRIIHFIWNFRSLWILMLVLAGFLRRIKYGIYSAIRVCYSYHYRKRRDGCHVYED